VYKEDLKSSAHFSHLKQTTTTTTKMKKEHSGTMQESCKLAIS